MVSTLDRLQTLGGRLRQKAQGRSPQAVARKGANYAIALVNAKRWLRDVDQVGLGVRTVGRPRIENFGSMSIGDGVVLRSVNVPLELCTEENAELRIGADCSLNYGVSIGVTERVTLGDRVRLGPYVMVVDSAFHDLYDRSRRPPSAPVVIADDVWIGAKASVLPGVTVGRGAVVGTGAVVTKDVPAFGVVAGVPAQLLRTLDAERFDAKLASRE